MRHAIDTAQFTPLGIFLQQYCSWTMVSITNIDYYIENYADRAHLKIMLLEEKQNNGAMGSSQRYAYHNLHKHLKFAAPVLGTDYWGIYLLRLPEGATMPGPGMTLNGRPITCEQFVSHVNFEQKFCEGLFE